MSLPHYVTLAIISICLFLASTISILLTHALYEIKISPNQRRRFSLKVCAYVAIWLCLVLGLSYTNIFVPAIDQTFPILGFAILGSAIFGNLLLWRSQTATQILQTLPLHLLATIQVFRVIGVLFLMLESDGLLSTYFATSTGWGDIFVGVTAPIVGYLLWKDAYQYRLIGLAWCFAGIADLVFVLYKAINSAPGPLQTTSFDLPTVAIGYFPLTIVPLLVVPIALILHVQMIRKVIWLNSSTNTAQ